MQALKSLKDEPGTQREYETIFILRGDTPNDGVGSVNSRVKGILDHMGGKVLKVDNWGKRKLAYEVEKQLKGIYLYWRYLGTSGVVEEIERNLRMLDSVIRYYTVKIDEDVLPDARPSDVSDETWTKVAETAADEEEIMTGQARSPFFEEEDEIDTDAEEEAIRRAAANEQGEEAAKPEDKE
ncbi:MAG TPA: 30S ribosomal protein S6 [Haliangiales bacterium]|nr:30S ribosomal protein S6 [Haliangiales bacterium]